MTDTAASIKSVQCREALRALQDKYGYEIFRREATAVVRARLQVDAGTRERRKRFKPQTYRFLYNRQRGICPLCSLAMVRPPTWPGDLEIDHIDPNRDDFGADSNLQLTHGRCNASKGGKSIQEQSKASGKTFTGILGLGAEDDAEEEETPAFLRKIMD